MRTNWIVITGAPCAGKTTLLDSLHSYGYRYVPEIARVYIEAQLRLGRTLAQIRGDEGAFQKALMPLKIEIEKGLQPNDLVFMDRACPDSLSYYRAAGVPIDSIARLMTERTYARIFLLDKLPMEDDPARNESDQKRNLIETLLFEDYSALGYEVIRVPVLPLTDRVSFVLKRMPGCLEELDC